MFGGHFLNHMQSNSLKYSLLSVITFIIFGLTPIYWVLLSHIDSHLILFHRGLWTFLVLSPCIFYKSNFRQVAQLLKMHWHYFLLSAAFISLNWFTFVYSVNHGHFFEASLAYFISPLISIVLGFFLLKETIKPKQWIAVIFATLSIIYLLIAKGIFPKFALVIGVSFAMYGIMGRRLQAPPILRLMIESFIISTFFMCFLKAPGELLGGFLSYEGATQLLLATTGVITAFPLMMYIVSVKNVKFTTIGIFSFILPTVGFLVGVFYFKDALDREKLISIILIWVAVLLYISELLFPKKVEPTLQPVAVEIEE